MNIHYAEYRAGPDAGLYAADGRRIGALGDQLPPTAGDTVYDPPFKTWIHDVALARDGRPVVVFAGFPTDDDHRYYYARWTGTAWDVHEMVAAGGSLQEEAGQPYYSGGITLDHESTDTVYLSRDVDGVFEIETWRTIDGGATWSSTAITAASRENNVRPVSPRGQLPFSGDLGVIWMRGIYPHYLRFQTSIATTLATRRQPRAGRERDAHAAHGLRPAAQSCSTRARAPTRTVGVSSYRWDFGDGTSAVGEQRDPYVPRARDLLPARDGDRRRRRL